MVTRRRLGLLLCALLLPAFAACTEDPAATAQAWHGGTLTIGTGPTNGVFNQIGGGYADIVNRHLEGYEALAPPTNGAGENLLRLASDDVQVAFTFADTAADAAAGRGSFEGKPVKFKALARIFNGYTHLVVRANSGITSIKQLKGKRVATGPQNSGTELVALRLLGAAGLDVKRDITQVSASLSQMANLMRAGDLDAMFYAAGLPTVGVQALFAQSPGMFTLLPTEELFLTMGKAYPDIYAPGKIPKAMYGLSADVTVVAVPNLIVVREDMPADLAFRLTQLIFDYQSELAAVHPEGDNISRDIAALVSPLQLHSGAGRFYGVS
ncbi:TAXI family TRAP transporter solute-binding subunit [Saccharothrix algeriensis]|uniref:C4-dicarboxylate ABC transporter substrate-binding protein n=1 Tax=Catellatospora bangladeshensis TaxID=310355 RepID=A0A8J3JU63_9ACTN|nr:C4-dicarboxylate ABC transporter substrate-binding protein [Catellatospora bangladeshensis]